MEDPPQLQDVAVAAAIHGGDVIRAGVAGRAVAPKDKGLPGDYVTAVDLASEAAIRRFLATATPTIPVVGEEAGGLQEGRHWLVDPLDGTTNFLHGFPAVAVSVALIDDGRPTVGCVHAPFLGLTYAAARATGAWNLMPSGPARLSVSARPPERAVLATGFPFRRKELLPRYLRMFEAALHTFEDLRRPGAAALDLAWTAAGVFDGFFELALAPWDVAAGALLIEEAGGTVTDWTGTPNYLPGTILAAPPAIHTELKSLAQATRD
jgi:myo-inositol-1(or 4)-monophosphatase